MKNKRNKILIKEVIDDYNGKIGKRSEELNFLKQFSKSKIYVSKKTGCVYHSPDINTKSSLLIWSNKIFSKKIFTDNLKYTSNNPIMKSRHYYSAIFVNNYFNQRKNIKFCDYGAGEGNFGLELLKINNNIHYHFTEFSKKLHKQTVKKLQKISKKNIFGYCGSIETSNSDSNFKRFDAASLLWTLCNCVKPLQVLETIHKSLKKDGILLISESSRILVPFKKPIYNFFVKKHHTQNTHPWFFSYNSLSNLLEVSGFKIIKKNRYYDENDLVIIAKKVEKNSHYPNIKVDKFADIINFFKEWKKHTNFLKNKIL